MSACHAAPPPAMIALPPNATVRRRAFRPRAAFAARCAAVLAIGLFAGCGPAQSNPAANQTMFFGLFGKKYASTVNPQVGAAFKTETAVPAQLPTPPVPAYPQLLRVAASGPPPAGTLKREPSTERAAVEAHVLEGAGGLPPVAVVNTFGDDRQVALWQLDARDPTRFDRLRATPFDADQAKWVLSSASEVIALPARRLLLQLSVHRPQATVGLYVYDVDADRITALGRIQPDWSKGVPFVYLSSLQLRPDTLLVMHHTDEERLGPQRYVNHFDHLVLYSPRFPDGLAVATLGIDDGNVRQWGFSGQTLWLRTVDDRVQPPRESFRSLDLGRVL